jgi:hypothetical protein
MVIGIFSPSKVDEFAKSLARDIARRYPPAIANNPDQIVSHGRIAEILDQVFVRAREFRAENQLGMLSRMKLGYSFKWELREFGYEDRFVDVAAEKLADHMMREAA